MRLQGAAPTAGAFLQTFLHNALYVDGWLGTTPGSLLWQKTMPTGTSIQLLRRTQGEGSHVLHQKRKGDKCGDEMQPLWADTCSISLRGMWVGYRLARMGYIRIMEYHTL